MDDVRTAADWLKAERKRVGWSTTDVARQAVTTAAALGESLSLTQQSVSNFENLKVKAVPRWLQFVRRAFEIHDFGERPGGAGAVGPLSPLEAELVLAWRSLATEVRLAVMTLVRAALPGGALRANRGSVHETPQTYRGEEA